MQRSSHFHYTITATNPNFNVAPICIKIGARPYTAVWAIKLLVFSFLVLKFFGSVVFPMIWSNFTKSSLFYNWKILKYCCCQLFCVSNSYYLLLVLNLQWNENCLHMVCSLAFSRIIILSICRFFQRKRDHLIFKFNHDFSVQLFNLSLFFSFICFMGYGSMEPS